jgi:PAS domain S-box-containing protein
MSTSVLETDDGKLHALALMLDVTERKKMEERLSIRNAAIESSITAIGIIDLAGKVTHVNEACVRMWGYEDKNEVVGRHISEFWEGKTVFQTLKNLEEEGIDAGEDLGKRKDGSLFNVLFAANVVRDKKDEPIGMLGSFVDITDRKRMEEAVRTSEEKYRTLSANIPGMVYRGKEDWSIDLISNSESICGYSTEDFRRRRVNWLDLVHPDDREEVKRVSEQLAMAGGNTIDEYRIIAKGGDVRWVEDHKTSRFTEEEVFIGVDGVVFDITRRREAEEGLRKFKLIADRAGHGVAIADLGGNLLYVNESFADMHGLKAIELIGSNLSIIHNEEQMARVNELNGLLEKQGRYVAQEVWHKRADNTVFLILMNATVVKNEKGEPAFMAATAIDITEHKQAEEKLAMYHSKMARTERLASLGTLSATAAHEITQPLTVLQLSLQNAMDELDATSCPDTVIEKLRESFSEALIISSIIDRFRGFARRSSHPTVGEVDLQAVAERIIDLLDGASRRKGTTLRLEGMDGLPHVSSDEKDLEQLFFALIDNAIREGNDQQHRQIVISGAVTDDHIELRFSDNCGGIAPENLDRIFEPFFTTKPAGEGTGLGLCIVQDILSRVRGKIRVESTFGKGSTFVVTIPIHVQL